MHIFSLPWLLHSESDDKTFHNMTKKRKKEKSFLQKESNPQYNHAVLDIE